MDTYVIKLPLFVCNIFFCICVCIRGCRPTYVRRASEVLDVAMSLTSFQLDVIPTTVASLNRFRSSDPQKTLKLHSFVRVLSLPHLFRNIKILLAAVVNLGIMCPDVRTHWEGDQYKIISIKTVKTGQVQSPLNSVHKST